MKVSEQTPVYESINRWALLCLTNQIGSEERPHLETVGADDLAVAIAEELLRIVALF